MGKRFCVRKISLRVWNQTCGYLFRSDCSEAGAACNRRQEIASRHPISDPVAETMSRS